MDNDEEKVNVGAEELYQQLQPFNNIMPVILTGQHYDRSTREQILKNAEMLSLTKDEIQSAEKDIDRYKEYEVKVRQLVKNAELSEEDIVLADQVCTRIKTIISEEESGRVRNFIIKMAEIIQELENYKDLFGKTNE